MLLYLEIQRGKAPRGEAEFCNELHMVTTACTVILEKNAKRVSEKNGGEVTDTSMGDSWFGSITAAVHIKKINNCKFIGIVKTSSKGFPKHFYLATMNGRPAGSHLVLESTVDGVELLLLDTSITKKKVAIFISTKDAGHMGAGTPYEAKQKDDNNNTCSRNIFCREL
eukprot:10270699-Ditylum_brightwellii.AAC.1